MLKIFWFIFVITLSEAKATLTVWNEESLRETYLKVTKVGFPKDISVPGSIKPHHEKFLWEVLNDRRFRRSWPMAICLLGYIGNEKTLEKLRDFAERNFKNWIKGEFFDIDKALIYALSSFSNRGFDSATEVLFVGTKPGFWRMLIKTKYPKTKKLEEKVELLTSHCILALVYLTTPKALELLEELRNDLEYPLQSDVAFAISEIKERNSRNP